jgi:hypothetical protein
VTRIVKVITDDSIIVIDKERGVAEEFHVDTPKKDGGVKKKKKYGWMQDKHGDPIEPSDLEPKKKLQARSLDAIFIAPSHQEAMHYVRALRYNRRNVLICTVDNYDGKLRGISPDEDLPVHICGSWLRENISTDLFYELDDLLHFLDLRGIYYERLPEIG